MPYRTFTSAEFHPFVAARAASTFVSNPGGPVSLQPQPLPPKVWLVSSVLTGVYAR